MTHRGLSGQVERGFHAGNVSYGYRSVVAGYDARGGPIGYRLEVHEPHAGIVREIFARYGTGESCQRVVADLNARAVPGPRGGTWCVSALYGSPAKGSGILNNELYIGHYVWNRSRWVRNPDTRKRERLIRPESDWKVDERPELRIIDDATWQRVRARMSIARAEGGRAGRGGIPTTLLGGILRCGLCGGAVVKISASSYGCAARRDRGPAVCTGVTAATKRVDEELVGHVRQHLESPVVLAQLEREASLLVADRGTRSGNRRELGQRVRDLEGEASRLADAIAALGISPTLTRRLRQVEAEVAIAKRARASAPVATLSSTVRESVRALLRDLGGALSADLPVARDALRAALGNVTLENDEDGVVAVFEDTADRLLLRAVGDGMGLVAGARNHLYRTFMLWCGCTGQSDKK